MESIVIIIAGLIFSVLSKSVKQKKEIEEEKKKRVTQLERRNNQSFESPVNQEIAEAKDKQKSLRDIFLEELDNMDEGEGRLGEVFKKTFQGKETPKKVQGKEIESKSVNLESINEQANSDDGKYMTEEEYLTATYSKNEDDFISKTEVASDSKIQTKIEKTTIGDSRGYSPFSKSLNRKDIIRGIIFSEVLDRPKSLRDKKRSI